MLWRLMRRAARRLGRIGGVHMPRPRNLILVPTPLVPDHRSRVTAAGRDIEEIVAGCGGTLAVHAKRGGEVLIVCRAPLATEDREALTVLGIPTDRVLSGQVEADGAVRSSSLVLLPFPPEGDELALVKKVSDAPERLAFFDGRLVSLIDREFRIDEVREEKERALACTGSDAAGRRAMALSAYRSVATGRGRGFTEGFLSGGAGLRALGVSGFPGRRRSPGRGSPFYRRYVNALLPFRDACAGHRVTDIPGRRTLVISPHYDDEVIGAGGTLMSLREKGRDVLVVYVTDGREGIPSLEDPAKAEEIRRKESERALSHMGVADSVHLRVPETRVRPYRSLVSDLMAIVNAYHPDSVILPWFFDNHVDHVEVNRVLVRLARTLDPGVLILGSEVWTPLPPNLIVDCSAYAERKRQALECFASQLAQVDYLRTSLALGERRAVDAGAKRLAEAFSCLPARLYVDWIRRAGIASMRFSGVGEDP